MDNGRQCFLTQIITGDGVFNTAGIENLVREVGLAEYGLSYAVVAIMGPQSGGKSTLLNHLFKTNFREMDADEGRSQTTKGIWIAECAGIEPCTLVMDLEGSDGRERGEDDDTTFEKQGALFALAVSDIVLINMWCHDIGRDQAANRPLLKIVFEVMLKLFSQHKTTLMFVIRDKTRTPLEKLELILRKDIQRIWDSVQKPDAHKETPLSEFFNVEVVALCSFEKEEVEFKEQVASLRQRFFDSKSPGGLAGNRQGVVPGSGFSLSAQQMWEVIKENKDLDLPSLKVMVATVRCEEIANENFESFVENENWCQLEESVKTEAVSGFGQRVNSIFDSCLSEYDKEVAYFDARVRSVKRKELEGKIMLVVDPVFQLMLVHISSETFEGFKKALEDSLNHGKGFSASVRDCTDSLMAQFDSRCADASFHQANWFECRNNFQLRIDAHTGEVRAGQLVKLNASYEKNLSKVLSEGVGALLNEADSLTWPRIRSLLHDETASAVLRMTAELANFDMDEQSKAVMLADMEEYARQVVLLKAKDEAGRVLILMKDRFLKIFIHDDVNIQHLNHIGRSASLKILVVLAAAPMDDEEDNIMGRFTTLSFQTLFASDSWEQISLSTICITPYQCHDYWMQFCSWADIIVSNATPVAPAAPAAPVQAVVHRGPVESLFGGVGGAIDKIFGRWGG